MDKRHICWPEPDATCLEGGCGFCSDEPLRSVDEIRQYAEDKGTLPNRYGNGMTDALAAFHYGERNKARR